MSMALAREPDVVAALVAALGTDRVRSGDDIPQRNRADASGLTPTPPLALLLPRSTEEVSTALRICHAHGQAVVTQGGMTGLAGGAHPIAGEVALSLERMSGVEEVDTAAGTLTALAGTPLQQIQAAAEEAGFFCGIDLGARGSCTIGGNVATNAGGNQVLRFGMARRNVMGLEVVLADGTVVRSLNKMLKNNAGYDWAHLFIGSEGTLGVVTRVVLGLHAKPEGLRTALLAVDSVGDALSVLRQLERSHPGGLLVFEAMGREFMDVAERIVGLPRPFEATAEITLLVEVATGEGERADDPFEASLATLYERGLVKDALIAKSGQEAERFWAYRESPYEYGRFFERSVGFDVSIPLARMAGFVEALRERMRATFPEALFVVFGHLADSNLHINVSLPGGDKPAIERLVYALVSELGGSVSAEHGIGRNKRPYLPLSRTEPELQLMGVIKQALDPGRILNPGRVL